MKKNIGPSQRSVRMMLGNMLILSSMFGYVSPKWNTAVFIMGVTVLVTSLFSFCPVYALVQRVIKRPGSDE